MAALDHYNKLEDFEIVRTDSKHRYLYNAEFHVFRRD